MRISTLLRNAMLFVGALLVSVSAMAQTNLLSNPGFEEWNGSSPAHWTTASTAGNADLAQSTDAHSGKYSVSVHGIASSNKRLGYEEMTLKAGTYKFTFYTKAATADGGSARPGYVPFKADGSLDSGNYTYGDYVNNLTNSEWVKVEHEFTLAADTKLCLVIMCSKNPGKDILIDDASLTTSDGGSGGGNDDNPPAEIKAISIAEFNALPVSSTYYQLTGVVGPITDGDQYGNFDLTDETGSVYVYGLLSEKGGAKKQFQTLMAEKGICEGCTLTLIGQRAEYQGKIEVGGAYFVSIGANNVATVNAEDAPVLWYDLTGRRIDAPAGLCIRVQGEKVMKVMVR